MAGDASNNSEMGKHAANAIAEIHRELTATIAMPVVTMWSLSLDFSCQKGVATSFPLRTVKRR